MLPINSCKPNVHLERLDEFSQKEEIEDEFIVPEIIRKLEKNNLEQAIQAIETDHWAFLSVSMNKKASFFGLLNLHSGEMEFMKTIQEDKKTESIHAVRFIYESEKKVIFDRKEFYEQLNDSKKGISITAAKMLLVIEQILSHCHSFSARILEEYSDPVKYTGALIKVRLEALLESGDKLLQVIKDVNDPNVYPQEFDVDFLIGHIYQTHILDNFWGKNYKNPSLKDKELLVVRRSDGTKRYCRVQVVEKAKWIEGHLQLALSLENYSYYNWPPHILKERLVQLW